MNNLSAIILCTGIAVLLASLGKLILAIPEPELPIKTPLGRLRFFDGMILYGSVILVLLCLANQVLY
jgi:hypothetical protein